ncbi:OmpA family protein [Dyadobacter frigoris]|uniref:OmpA family protein n=1 Tax=Dyadobacter frigoris TaxID=2576211 RepID=UPI0014854FE0|nr:OmpA family protein [Dyadobacter frigoris]
MLVLILQTSSAQAQSKHDKIRTSFGMSGGAGYRRLSTDPKIENGPWNIFTYAGKPQSDWFGDYYTITEKGEKKKVFFREVDLDLMARYTIMNGSGNGWLFNLSYNVSRNSYSFDNNPTFQFKNYTLSRRNGDLEAWSFQGGIARFWDYDTKNETKLFIRLGAGLYTGYTTGGLNIPVNKNYQQTYIEKGAGFRVSFVSKEDHVFYLIPEVGLTAATQPIEITLSAHIPSKSYIFSERYSFYQKNTLVDETVISYGTFHTVAMLRVGFSFFKTFQKDKKKYKNTTINNVPPPNDKSSNVQLKTDSRFDIATKKAPIMLRLYFEEGKSDLLDNSTNELNDLASWLIANPTIHIQLNGHTDMIGDHEKNQILSIQRVVQVKNFLSLKGIEYQRVEIKGFGDTKPICAPPCAENRRVEMVILKK